MLYTEKSVLRYYVQFLQIRSHIVLPYYMMQIKAMAAIVSACNLLLHKSILLLILRAITSKLLACLN